MRVYLEVARRAFARQSTYRAATAAGVFTNTVFGFMIAYVLLAVFAGKSEINGFTAADAVTFTFVSQGLIFLREGGDFEQANRIGNGDVIIDFYRPIDYQGYWGSLEAGKVGFLLLGRGIAPFVIAKLWFDEISLPPEWWLWPVFLVSLALAVAISLSYRFLLQSIAFWLLDVRGPNQIGQIAAMFFGGAFVPLFLFPPALLAVARVLPYPAMLQWPVEIFLGAHTGTDLAVILAVQVFWVVVMALLARSVLGRATRKVVIQGG